MAAEQVEIVRNWHAALNARDIEALLALSHRNVEVGGPRGSDRGAEALRSWFDRSAVQVTPRRYFHRGSAVVVEQDFRWVESDAPAPAPPLASVFLVQNGRIVSMKRHPDLATALDAAGITEADRA